MTTTEAHKTEAIVSALWDLAERVSDTPYGYIIELLDDHRTRVEEPDCPRGYSRTVCTCCGAGYNQRTGG